MVGDKIINIYKRCNTIANKKLDIVNNKVIYANIKKNVIANKQLNIIANEIFILIKTKQEN